MSSEVHHQRLINVIVSAHVSAYIVLKRILGVPSYLWFCFETKFATCLKWCRPDNIMPVKGIRFWSRKQRKNPHAGRLVFCTHYLYVHMFTTSQLQQKKQFLQSAMGKKYHMFKSNKKMVLLRK